MIDIKSSQKTKVYLGMSGGVDSAVSAVLLLNQGYDVTGIYMKNWSNEDFGIETDCPWQEDMKDVQQVCEQLGIEFRSYNFEKEYRERVVENFFAEYKAGRTPNPDVLCNSEIKFDSFLSKALSEGADFIATGHYARIQNDDGYKLLKGVDSNKDQSYFLSGLNQFQLSKTIFPVGEFTKPEVRRIAKENNISVAEKKDSQGICFIGDIDVGKFLRSNIAYSPGDIVDADTELKIGSHDGVAFYTIGQREGLKIGGMSPDQKPYFVCGKDINLNVLYVVEGNDNPKLFRSSLVLSKINWIAGKINFPKNGEVVECEISIRYRQKPVKCKIKFSDNTAIVNFENPIRAVSAGQVGVMYLDEVCLGNGVID